MFDLDLMFTEAAAAELAAQQAEEEAEEGRQLLHASLHCMTLSSHKSVLLMTPMSSYF